MTKLAHVYERNGEWYYQPSSKTVTGLWIATPPLIQLSSLDPKIRKGKAALEVLGASQQGLPLPENPSSVIAPLLAKVGVRSWREFMKKARGIGLELEMSQLTVTPHRQLPRSKGALEGVESQQILLPADAAPEEIGAALEEAMSRSQ
jgi:hypothetical protein